MNRSQAELRNGGTHGIDDGDIRLEVVLRHRRTAIVGFLLVVFTFLGVNLVAGGKHSYTSLLVG